MERLNGLALTLALLMLTAQGYADDHDHEQALQLHKTGKILALEQILVISRQQIAGRILEVELEREQDTLIYELEILDDKGRVWELKIDATNGQLLEQELEQ